MKVTNPITIKRLNKVKETILKSPQNFDIMTWTNNSEIYGTIYCIAGYAIQLFGTKEEKEFLKMYEKGYYHPLFNPAKSAATIFDLKIKDAVYLFRLHNWPEKFKKNILQRMDKNELVEITARRIDHFLETGK